MMIKVCNGHAVSLSELLETVVEHVKDLEAKLGDEIQDADRITMSAFELKEKLVALQKLRDQDRTEVEKLYEERADLEAAVLAERQRIAEWVQALAPGYACDHATHGEGYWAPECIAAAIRRG